MSTAAVTLPTATHPQDHVENMARTMEQIFAQCANDNLEPEDCKFVYETFVQAVRKYPPDDAPDDSCELLANVLCALRKPPPMDDLRSFIAGYSRYTRRRYLHFAHEQERTAKAQLAQACAERRSECEEAVTRASKEREHAKQNHDYVLSHGVWEPRLLKIVNACRPAGSEENGSNQAADGQVPGRQVREGEGGNNARVQERASSTAALLDVDKDGHRSFPGAVVARTLCSRTERTNTRASDTRRLIIKLPAQGTKSVEGNPNKPHGLESAQPHASTPAIDRTAEITALRLEYEITCHRVGMIRKAMEIMENEEVLLTGEPFGEFTDEFIESAKNRGRSDEDSTIE